MAGNQSAAASNVTHRDAMRTAFRQVGRGPVHTRPQLHLRRQYVGSASGQNSERNLGVDHALGDLIDRAVAPGGEYEIETAAYVLAGNFGRGSGTGRGYDRQIVTRAPQNLRGMLQR